MGTTWSSLAWFREVADDPVSIRIIRLALGVTISVALAYGIEWPLSFLFPVLTAVFLSLPLSMPSLLLSQPWRLFLVYLDEHACHLVVADAGKHQ